ncbi:MAG: DJ-1/PfpI family protein [Holophagales bacterium]|nr:DJ-1/PfpI family protein [Holophagales bacterium]
MTSRSSVLALLLTLAVVVPTTASEMSLDAPERGKMPVAFLLSEGADVIDFGGPWGVFQYTTVPGRGVSRSDTTPFELFTVAETRQPLSASGGLKVVPDYTFADAPQPRVIVVPAQAGVTPALLDWLRTASPGTDLTMSVCTGAFVLARAGLLDGKQVTTHHNALDQLERSFPQLEVKRDVRWVEGRRISTAAGLTSGIDLALRVVTRYFGEEVAARTAEQMEYRGTGWRPASGLTSEEGSTPSRSAAPAAPVVQGVLRGLDPVQLARGREVTGDPQIFEMHEDLRYHFASEESRLTFRAEADRYSIQLGAACARMALDGAPPGSGDMDRFLVHEGRIYVFASEVCRQVFQADPRRYLPDP